MRHIGSLAVAAAALLAVPALAQDAGPAAPPPAFTVSGGATVVSDYRFRGISQTDKHFAIQGTLTVSHASGLYVGTWGSSIDDYVAATSDQEIDIFAGYKKTVGAATIDGGVLYYYYPGNLHGTNTDFFEPYLSVTGTAGPVSLKAGAAYAWSQKALVCVGLLSCGPGKQDNLYVYGEASGALGKSGVGLTAHVGHDFGPSYLSSGRKGYWDWNLGANYTWNHITFGVSYVDTNIKKSQDFVPNLTTSGGTHVASAGVVGSIGVSF